MNPEANTLTIKVLRVIALFEGLSFLILMGIAMPLKYYADSPKAVEIVGMAHGILFVLYCFNVVFAHFRFDWTYKKTGLALLASVLPFGTFVADVKLFR